MQRKQNCHVIRPTNSDWQWSALAGVSDQSSRRKWTCTCKERSRSKLRLHAIIMDSRESLGKWHHGAVYRLKSRKQTKQIISLVSDNLNNQLAAKPLWLVFHHHHHHCHRHQHYHDWRCCHHWWMALNLMRIWRRAFATWAQWVCSRAENIALYKIDHHHFTDGT